MRLLLLLSALFAALTGVAIPRATAQPVQASAAASVAASAGTIVADVAQRFSVPAYGTVPPLSLAALEAVRVAAHPLYAERRRE